MQYLRSWSNRRRKKREEEKEKEGKWFVRSASRLHETSFPSRRSRRIYERKCTVCYPVERDRLVIPFRQVINVPLLRKRIHLRIHLVSRSSPRRCILQQARGMQIVRSRFWSRNAKKSSVKFLRPSIDRAYLVVDRYVSPRGSFPEVIKYPTKSLCCRGWLKAIPKAPSGQA